MKLLSDFDGVWTLPDEEGVANGAALDGALEDVLGEGERSTVRAWIARARSAVHAEPGRWGWSIAGRISAFADEDPFTVHGALLHYLDVARGNDPLAARLAAAIEERDGSLGAFGGRAHVGGVRAVEARRGPAITEGAVRAGRELLGGGIEVVVVSNSGTEKLKRWFDHAGLPNQVHPERADGALRLRGSAQKFVLSPEQGDMLDVGGLSVDVARPRYEAVLREERPDAIVGDVFSLDIALPLALKRREPGWRNVRLFWLVQPYTPDRVRRALASLPDGDVERVEGGLPGVADRLLAKP
jgi:hypothetical protein